MIVYQNFYSLIINSRLFYFQCTTTAGFTDQRAVLLPTVLSSVSVTLAPFRNKAVLETYSSLLRMIYFGMSFDNISYAEFSAHMSLCNLEVEKCTSFTLLISTKIILQLGLLNICCQNSESWSVQHYSPQASELIFFTSFGLVSKFSNLHLSTEFSTELLLSYTFLWALIETYFSTNEFPICWR